MLLSIQSRWLSAMTLLRIIPVVLLLSACAHQPNNSPAVTDLYCDRYLLYRMCAIDVTNNGQTDFLYFENTDQIFLFDPDKIAEVPTQLSMHECAQSMDEALIAATSLLLTVNDEMGFFRRSEIKNKIFYHYMRYVPRINRCNRERGNQNEEEFNAEDDPFLADNDEFGI